MKAGRRFIAHYLRRRRERELDITQLEISRRMNLESHMFVSLIERAMCPIPAERVRDIARAYEIEEENFYLWFSVARWIDEEVPLGVILYIIDLPPDEPEGVAGSPSVGPSTGPTGGCGVEREVDSFLRRLLRCARTNGKAARTSLKKLACLIVSLASPLSSLLLIRSISARRNFLPRPLFLWSSGRSRRQSLCLLPNEISFLPGRT